MSPATPFSDASLPNHTKMFELVHLVTSVDDFAGVQQKEVRDQGFPKLSVCSFVCVCYGRGGKAGLGVQLCRWEIVSYRVRSSLTPTVVAAKAGSYHHGASK